MTLKLPTASAWHSSSLVEKGEKICELLFMKYPDPQVALNFSNPLELLVAIILSAQCTDKRVNELTPPLFNKYMTPEEYAEADAVELESLIRPAGFFRNKAKAIRGCCKKICKDYGGSVPSTMEELVTLPGVGRKSANAVLGGAFGKEAIAVDTHMLRVSKRLGLTSSTNPDVVEKDLMKAIPHEVWTKFNRALILHGRETCKARKPLCGSCVLFSICEWTEKDFPCK